MSKKLVACLLAIAFALAGCLGGDDDDVDTDDDDQKGGANGDGGDDDGDNKNGDNDNGDGSDDEEEEVNEPPTVGLDADPVTGLSPLEVVFSLQADDPNGDNLTWTLFIEDDETIAEGTDNAADFPIEVTHEFTTNKYPNENFTVALNITDGEFSRETNVTFAVDRAPNDPQEGSVDMCVRNYGLPLWGTVIGTFGSDEDPELVDVEPNTFYSVEADGDVQIAFMNADGGDRTFEWGTSGKVPEGRVLASVCVSADTSASPLVIVLPTAGAAFTYQDGLQE